MNGQIVLSGDTVIGFVGLLAAIVALITYFVKIHNWYLKQESQDKDIKAIKEEQTLMVYAMRACLDGLQQLGCNHTVPDAKDKLDKYINKKAHDQVVKKGDSI
jgi:hypothetical protein